MSSKLTKKQEMFCKEYLKDLNATQAAIRAGYSEKTAKDIASQNLAKLNISKRIQELMDKRSKKVEITANNVLESILRTRDTCQQYLLIEGEYGPEINNTALNGLTKNNELLGKHLKLFTDKVEHSGSVDISQKSKEITSKLFGD